MSDTDLLEQPPAGIAVPGEEQPQTEAREPSAPSGGEDIEARARAQGWVPRDEFRGDPEKWRPADEFVKRGEELLPVALERSRAAERRAQELEARLAAKEREFEEKMGRLERMSVAAVRRERERLDAMYRNAQRSAVESGDVQRWDQLDRDRQVAIENYDRHIQEQVAPPPQDPSQPPQLRPEQKAVVDAWIAQNEWYTRDPELKVVAEIHHERLGRERPGLSLAENLAETARYVRQRYADKFGGSSRQITHPMVDGGGGRMPSSAGRRAKSAADLPADVRAVGERFVKDGLYDDINDYAREYFEQG